MESTSLFIGINIGLVAVIIYVLDPAIFQYLELQLQNFFISIRLRSYQGVFRIRLWYDKQSLRPGPVGRFLRDRQLKAIQRNPAYSEFFNRND